MSKSPFDKIPLSPTTITILFFLSLFVGCLGC